MIGTLLKPELIKMIDERDSAGLRVALAEFPGAEIAEIFEEFDVERKAVMFRLLPEHLSADLFEHLDQEERETIADALRTEEVAGILDEMEPPDRTDFLEDLEESDAEALLSKMRPDEREMASQLLDHPEDSIGRIMSPEFVSIEKDWTGAYVIEHLRAIGMERRESLNEMFVTDAEGKLVGSLELADAVIASPDRPVADLVHHQVVALRVTDDQETAVQDFQKYDRSALPVVDESDRLVGLVKVDDVMDVAEEEVTEDMHKMAAMEALDEAYLSASLFSMVRKRVGWLAILFGGQLLTALAMMQYETALLQFKELIFFLPLIISSGGNCGSQAATLIIRSMAVQELDMSDWWRVVRREMSSGLALGLAMAALALVMTALAKESLFGPDYWKLGISIAFSLVGVVIFGCLFGGALPFILRALKFDPAVCSTPLVMTLVDVSGLIIYMLIAGSILGFSLG